MMNTRAQILVISIAAIFLILILQLVRKQKLEIRYAFLWILLSISIFIMGCFPQLITVISRLCGIQTPVNMLFFIGICFLLVIIFSLSTALSRNSEKLKQLTQEIGLLEERLRNVQSEEDKRI